MKRSSFLAELKFLLKNKKILISIIAVAFVPLLYAGMFLWAFWDPYAHLDNLPVAVVNEDKGAEFEGEKLEIGKELAEKLKDSEKFDFHIVSKEKGYEGLENRDYYLLVEIPENFSKNATTILDDEPKKLEIKYVPNESTNFLSAQIGETAMKEVKSEISKKIIETYAETMFDSITELADGLNQASDGASQLKDGIAKLDDGSKTLSDNLATLASKMIEFKKGANTAAKGSDSLASGSSQIKDGLKQVNDKLPALVSGTSQVENGIKQMKEQLPAQVAAGISEKLKGGVNNISAGIDQLETQMSSELSSQLTAGIVNGLSGKLAEQTVSNQAQTLSQIKSALVANGFMNEAQADAFMAQVASQAPSKEQIEAQYKAQLQAQLEPQISAGVSNGIHQGLSQFETSLTKQLLASANGIEDELKSKTAPAFDQLIAGLDQITAGGQTLQNGISKLYKGSVELANGAGELKNGMDQLSSGAGQLQDGAGKLAEGAGQLKDGADKLLDGSTELADKLAEGAEKAGSVKADDDTYDMMGEPVKVDKEAVHEVPNYGTGFAPYFMSLGLFVGSLMLSIVFEFKRPVIRPKNPLTWFASKFGIVALVGIVQALLVDFILLAVLKLEVESLPLFILTSVIVSFVFMALIQMLVTLLDDVGRFIAIIILILQLTTSAGTFPMEVLPDALQPVNAWLPMTYTVQAFKAAISSGDISYLWQNNFILLGYMAAFMLLTIGYLTTSFKRSKDVEMAAMMKED
ncbi:YhgE/Pip domain-containing protein [Ureibacillus terrenus]|uniref:YhgE/Pip domain-containing protein n=1 Tax=Ureibacillus terrenus TaxID=118246 RepID=UPI002E1E347A|nr:YhgE/Pip domain-containing protein [Ureibacillus terrenus]